MQDLLQKYRQEMDQELENILGWWMKYIIDEANGGFFGKVENDNTIHKEAPKGLVLHSRILWTFSAAYSQKQNPQYLPVATRAYNYLVTYFIDKNYGGAYWSIDYTGKPLDTKKQIYAIAFAVYALSEYALAADNEAALQHAKDLYRCIIDNSHDAAKGGYIEAFTQDWKEINDLRLSAKDSNEKKSMNTHLHILEAFANLYRAWPDKTLKQQVEEIISLFFYKMSDTETNHLKLFFDEDWNNKANIVSYGHDIEAAWLIQECAEIIHNEDLLQQVKKHSIKVAVASEEGLDADGGLWYEKEGNHLIKEKHWWPQAEAMVGFYNAYQLTGDKHFFSRSLGSWKFIQDHLLDKKDGEWYWGIKEDNSVMQHEDKAGMWKCPYHNGRACIELLKRIAVD